MLVFQGLVLVARRQTLRHGLQAVARRTLTVVPMARVSPSMTSGRITAWKKSVGDYVDCYDLLYEFDVNGLTDIDQEENVTTKMELECCDVGYLAVIIDPIEPSTCPRPVPGGTPVALLTDTIDELHQVQEQYKQNGLEGAKTSCHGMRTCAILGETTIPAAANDNAILFVLIFLPETTAKQNSIVYMAATVAARTLSLLPSSSIPLVKLLSSLLLLLNERFHERIDLFKM
ncbi:hypothetical protein Ae201684P_011327 [Aphanomyces euteiches]|nr:hypothetical protein Ae201684P_011327 [Aphanomyces euteiches]